MAAIMFITAVAPGKGRSSFPAWVFVVVVAIIMALVVCQLVFGEGPAVGWFPRSMRGSVNRGFRRFGWPDPYDKEGNEIPGAGAADTQRPLERERAAAPSG